MYNRFQTLCLHIHALPVAVQDAGIKGLAPVPVGVLLVDVLAQPGGLAVEDFIQRPGGAEPLLRRKRHGIVTNDLADVLAVADPVAVLHVVKGDLLDLLHHALVHGDHLPEVAGVVQAHARRAVGVDMGLALLLLGQLPDALLLAVLYHLCDCHKSNLLMI